MLFFCCSKEILQILSGKSSTTMVNKFVATLSGRGLALCHVTLAQQTWQDWITKFKDQIILICTLKAICRT